MKLAITIAVVFLAGVMCGIPIFWAVRAKLNILLTIPFSLLFFSGVALGAIWARAHL